MTARICEACGGRIERITGRVPIEFREDTIMVDAGEHDECMSCHEVYFSMDEMEDLERRAIEIARRDKGLLTPSEIRQLRTDLALTQPDLESLVGVGPKSVTRWEKGTVFQNKSVDKLMRMMWEFPSLIPLIAGEPVRACYVIMDAAADSAWLVDLKRGKRAREPLAEYTERKTPQPDLKVVADDYSLAA